MKYYFRPALIVSIVSLFLLLPSTVYADAISTDVTVGNATPSITAGPAESPATSNTSPANVGTQITFSATASDDNGDNYYLAICGTDAITNPNDGTAPTCTGQQFCVSAATADDAQATCNYTTQAGDDENEAWFAFVCDDATSNQGCTAAGAQGSGDSGSPLVVNHEPSVTVARSNNSPQDPGSDITYTVTATDSDTGGTADTYSMIVCSTDSITGSTCDATQLCADTGVTSGVGASCNYTVPTPTDDDSNYDGFVFVIDSHDFGSSSNVQWTANNIAPVVSLASTNAGSAITLNGEQSTTDIDITATVTDNNGCQSELSTVEAVAYRSSVSGGASCTGDNNECYTSITCTVDGGSCSGSSDADATYTCTVSLQYHADPTVASTEFPTDTWLSQVTATDDDTSSHSDTATGVELNMFEALDITSTLSFGTLAANSTPSTLTETTTVTSTGNVGLDVLLQGDDMCTDYATCAADTIGVGNQRYGTSALAWGSATALTLSDVELETNFTKTTTTGSPTTGDIWWDIAIPDGQAPGSYTGQNDATAKASESVEW